MSAIQNDVSFWEHCEDAVIQAVIGAVTKPCKEARPCRNSALSGEQWTYEVLNGNPRRTVECCRMEAIVFRKLAAYLVKNGLKPSRKICTNEKLMIFLWIIGRGCSNRDAQERFQRSGETISRIFNEVLDVVVAVTDIWIKLPPQDAATPPEIALNTKMWPFFKDCIGAIDGTHVPAVIAVKKQSRYRNRKGEISQNVMAACSFDMRILFLLAGWEGSSHDGKVLWDAVSRFSFVVPEGKYYLVDAGYANTRQFLAPYRGVRYHLKEWAQGNSR